MTGQRALPGIGLTNRWTPGTSGWALGMDGNLAALDALIFLSVISSSIATPPTSPAQGDRYIVAAGATGVWAGKDTKIALYLDTSWTFFGPRVGWLAYVQDTGVDSRFDGAMWKLGGAPYTVQVWRYKMPSLVVEPILSIQMERFVNFATGFAVSRATCKTPASTIRQVLPIFKNASQVGTAVFEIGAATGSFTLASATTYAPGDVFEVYRSATPDPAFGGVRLTFAGNR